MHHSIRLGALRLHNAMRVQRYVGRAFARVGALPPGISVRYANEGNPPYDIRIERSGDRYALVLEDEGIGRITRSMRLLVSANAYWLSQCNQEVRHITVNASDGETVSNARFAASVRFPQHIGLPDPHYFEHRGFDAEMHAAAAAPAWRDRSDEITWRGGMNGNGWVSFSPEDRNNDAVLQRLRMVMHLKGMTGTDVKFSDMHPSAAAFHQTALKQGLLGAPMASRSWLGRKYAIDIDGYTNTWSNLLVRMHYGCCVLKVASQFGFRQWYYDGLKPYEHYVPVAADMSDFAEKIDWLRSHQAEAEAIAARGQALARSLTFASQTRRATEIIAAHWNRDALSYLPLPDRSPSTTTAIV